MPLQLFVGFNTHEACWERFGPHFGGWCLAALGFSLKMVFLCLIFVASFSSLKASESCISPVVYINDFNQ